MQELSNIEAEQAVLGALLVNNNAFIHVGHLTARHFYEPVHKRIFSVISSCWKDGKPFSPTLLKAEFQDDSALEDIGGISYLGKLVTAAVTVLHIAEHANLLIDLSHRRAIIGVLDEAMPLALNEIHESPAEIAMRITDRLSGTIADMNVSLFEDDFEVTQSILEDMKRDVMPFTTGYPKLDLAMGGGLYPGKSYGFAARKKVGKTILGGSIAQNLNIAGIQHLFICGEMSPEEIQKRTLARLLRVKQSMFNSRDKKQIEFMKKIAEKAMSSRRALIYKNAPGITFEDLKRYVLLARMQKKIKGFILDYWQLVGGKPKGKSTAEHLDEVAQWIADTCRKYDLWSITMAQINQEGNTRGGEGIRLAFDQVYILQAPNNDAGRSERWLEMSDTRYTEWRSVGSQNNPGFYLNELGPYFSETADFEQEAMEL